MYKFDLFDDIPVNSRICIYGAGETGLYVKKFIELTRCDIKIICFIDSFKSGKLADLDVINISISMNWKENTI